MSPAGLARTEWLGLTLVLAAATLWHGTEVAWPRFVAAFVAIDAIGYWPGAVAFRRARAGRIPALYAWLYNLTHNFGTAGAAIAAWSLVTGGVEWAMLAIPLHLAGDRGIFGNGFKRVDAPFEGSRGRAPEAA